MRNLNIPASIRSLPRRQLVLTVAGIFLAMFLSSLDQTVVGTAMPKIIADLGGFSHYTWVTTAYLITSTVAVPITGKLIDIYSRKYFYIGGLAVFTLGSLISGLSQTMTQLIIFRGFQGIGAGMIMANSFTVTADLFSPAERGKYVGIISGIFGLSSFIGPSLGGFITDVASWHWVFFVNIPLGIIVIALIIFFFPRLLPELHRHVVDYAGVVALILAVIPFMLALSWAGVDYQWSSGVIIGLLSFAVAMAIIFVLIERRAAEPVIPLWLFKNSIISISSVIIFFHGFGMFGAIIFIPLFFQGVLGATAIASGSYLTPMMLGMVVGSSASGQVLSRMGGHYRLQGAVGLAIMCLGMWLLSTMGPDIGNATVVLYIVILGLGLGITMPIYTIAVQNAVPNSVMGVATSATSFFRSVGGSLGLAIFGTIMTNRFALDFMSSIPAAVKTIVPAQVLSSLVHNPQALVSTQAQDQLKSMLANLGPQGASFFEQLLEALRASLSTALTEVFFIGFLILLVAFAANFFVKEIPLRKHR